MCVYVCVWCVYMCVFVVCLCVCMQARPSLIEMWHTDMTFSKTPPLGTLFLNNFARTLSCTCPCVLPKTCVLVSTLFLKHSSEVLTNFFPNPLQGHWPCMHHTTRVTRVLCARCVCWCVGTGSILHGLICPGNPKAGPPPPLSPTYTPPLTRDTRRHTCSMHPRDTRRHAQTHTHIACMHETHAGTHTRSVHLCMCNVALICSVDVHMCT